MQQLLPRHTASVFRKILTENQLTCFTVSNHLVGQAVCDLIDERHKLILPPDVWGDGEPEAS